MNEETKVDKDYKEAFNLGYELAKELSLKSPMFKKVSSGNNRMNAMQAGMRQYSQNIAKEKNKELDESQKFDNNLLNKLKTESKKDKGKGHDMSI
ncbi:hypothetical protein [Maribacter sp. ACAM166]|uniref:hypothetical protein n=1 Tax=Maribacter sp. ACAM166 TaxID=2508996 RepID=UPI0010FCECE6|nr:hypothetical protein [Maribacter sp. ACAM166]TLP70703.1 hypothetical protein ES765_20355 [Maribacter sp. ACAM166]